MDYQTRLNKLRERLSAANLDALLVTQPEDRRYLSGFAGTAGTLLVTVDAARLYTDFRYTERARAEAPDFEVIEVSGEVNRVIAGAATKLGAKRLGFEGDDLSYNAALKLHEVFLKADLELVDAGGIVADLRQTKDAAEIGLIEQAVTITVGALRHAQEIIRPGLTELALAWELEKYLREHGSGELPFSVIAASGPNAALPHAVPTERSIQAGESVIIDIGARVGGYTADMTRTFCAGTPDAKFREVYDLVARAQRAAYDALTPGISAAAVDAAARGVIAAAGYGDAFGHALGHGIGLATHENPRLAATSGTPLAEGMVFTLEPGVYFPGWGGVRIEDDVALIDGAARGFTELGEI